MEYTMGWAAGGAGGATATFAPAPPYEPPAPPYAPYDGGPSWAPGAPPLPGGEAAAWPEAPAPTAPPVPPPTGHGWAPPDVEPGHEVSEEITIGWAPPMLEGRTRARTPSRRPGARLSRRSLATLLIIPVLAGAAATVWLWAEGAALERLRTPSELMVAGGRVSGLLGTYLLLLQVALMARIPWLEHRIGSDWLTRAHRWLGSYVVALLVAHAGLLVGGYAIVDQLPFTDEAVMIITAYPGVFMATVALGLLVSIGALSLRMARAKLRYETWHFVHLYAYLAVALAFSHQLTSGADFIRQPAARVVWTGAHVVVAACVVFYRVVQPVTLSRRHKLRVHEVVQEGDRVLSIYVTGYGLDLMGAQPGQFFRWRFMTPYTWWQAHPFSLSAAPTKRMLRLTVKVVGDHTRMLQRLRPGTPVIAEGPYGALTDVQRIHRRVLLIAGGIGITPIRALLEGLPAEPGEITVLFRGDESAARVFAMEIETLAQTRGALVHYLLGPRARCCPQHDPLSAERISQLVPDVTERDVYICGSPGMMGAAQRALRGARVPLRQIHAERFDL